MHSKNIRIEIKRQLEINHPFWEKTKRKKNKMGLSHVRHLQQFINNIILSGAYQYYAPIVTAPKKYNQ